MAQREPLTIPWEHSVQGKPEPPPPYPILSARVDQPALGFKGVAMETVDIKKLFVLINWHTSGQISAGVDAPSCPAASPRRRHGHGFSDSLESGCAGVLNGRQEKQPS